MARWGLVAVGAALFAYASMQPRTDVGAIVWGLVAYAGLGAGAIGAVITAVAWWTRRRRRD